MTHKNKYFTKIMEYLKDLVEVRFFGVCHYLGEKMGIPDKYIKLYFIYATFIAWGSSIIVYLSLAFVLNLRDYIKSKKLPIWND